MNNTDTRTELRQENNYRIELLTEEIKFWREQLANLTNQQSPLVERMYEALNAAQTMKEFHQNNHEVHPIKEAIAHQFFTPSHIQDNLATKRLLLGHQDFFTCVAQALPSTLQQDNISDDVNFGRRYRDDIFLSIQARHPDVSMSHVRDLLKTIWSVHKSDTEQYSSN